MWGGKGTRTGRVVATGGARADLPMWGDTRCFCPLASVGGASSAWVVIGADERVDSRCYGCSPRRPLLRSLSKWCAAPARAERRSRPGSWSAHRGSSPVPQAHFLRSAKTGTPGRSLLGLAPLCSFRTGAIKPTKQAVPLSTPWAGLPRPARP